MTACGAPSPTRLGCTYARVPHSVIAGAHGLGMPTCWAVLMELFAYAGEDGGGLWASCPRSRVAETLGITEVQVKNAVDRLKRIGIISVRDKGRGGRATVYRVNASPGTYPDSVNASPGTYPELEADVERVSRNLPWEAVNASSGAYPKRTSKEVLNNGASLGEAPIPETPGGGALDAPPACYPKPRVLHPVNAMGVRP